MNNFSTGGHINPGLPINVDELLTDNKDGIVAAINELLTGAALQSVIVALTADQITTLHSSPVEVLPSPGPGKVILVSSVICELKFGTQGFRTNGAASENLSYSSGEASFGLQLVLRSTEDKIGLALATALSATSTDVYEDCSLLYTTGSDFTEGLATAITAIAVPGTGYVEGDTGTIDDSGTGATDATYTVTSVDGGGGITGIEFTGASSNDYQQTTGLALAATSGSGTDAQVDISIAPGDGTNSLTIIYRVVTLQS